MKEQIKQKVKKLSEKEGYKVDLINTWEYDKEIVADLYYLSKDNPLDCYRMTAIYDKELYQI